MRDGINLTQCGHPVVVFVHDSFEIAARAQARVAGMRDLRICVYPQYQPGGLSAQLEQAKAVKAAEEFPRLLERAS